MVEQFFMVFDVESVGLHGKDFAVGWTVVDRKGAEWAHGLWVAYQPWQSLADGPDSSSVAWLRENLPANLLETDETLPSRYQVHNEFWRQWLEWKEKGATLWADCGWPVEARFLIECIEDSPDTRTWHGPYPFHEIATALVMAGMDPLATYPRTGNETPKHNPLADARQSARLLIEALNRLAALSPEPLKSAGGRQATLEGTPPTPATHPTEAD
jgi:hypothetical protein